MINSRILREFIMLREVALYTILFCIFIYIAYRIADYYIFSDEENSDDDIFLDNASLPTTPPKLPPSPVELTPEQIQLKEFMKQREERIKNEEKVGVLRE